MKLLDKLPTKLPAKVIIIVPILCSAISIFWLIHGLNNYAFWDIYDGPRSAFLPSVIAALLLGSSILSVFIFLKKKEEITECWENWTILLAGFILFGLVFIIGMIPALLLFVLLWLKVYEKASWKHTIIVLCITFSISHFIFSVWLGTVYPRGFILETILDLIFY